MRVEQVDEPAAFLERAAPLLLADEARHNLMLGLAGLLRDHPDIYPEPQLWLALDGDEVAGAALQTPPHNLVLARPRTDAALAALARTVGGNLPGVVGAVPEVHRFAELCGRPTELRFDQGVYALERVQAVPAAPGAMRDATSADRELVLDWWLRFADEALHETNRARAERNVDHRLAASDDGIALWADGGEAVSLAGYGNPTPNGVRIGPVYTPPERRGRGYATTLVAELSQRLLDGGRSFCFLYTDLANPTSNAIYERIGYARVCESAELAFT